MLKSIYFVRHGQTISQTPTVIYGRNEIELSEIGMQQMRDLSKTIDTKVERIFCSPIGRSRKSAEILAANRIPVEAKPEISEIDFGQYAGKDTAKLPDVFVDKYQTRLTSDTPFPEGESVNDLLQRISRFHQWLVKQDLQSVCLVSHQWLLNYYLKTLIQADILRGANFVFKPGRVTYIQVSVDDIDFMAHNIDSFELSIV